MANIIPVSPKQEVEKYRNTVIIYEYNRHTTRWGFRFTHTQDFKIIGTAKGLAECKKEAHKRVDKLRDP